jgi:hypothetical protein
MWRSWPAGADRTSTSVDQQVCGAEDVGVDDHFMGREID